MDRVKQTAEWLKYISVGALVVFPYITVGMRDPNDMSLWLSRTKPDLFQSFLSKLKIVPVNQLKWLSKLDGILEELPGFSLRCEFTWIVVRHGENLAPK